MLTLYSRRGCHLCDEMLESLEMVLRGREATVTVVDVDTDPELSDRYGLRVPVLAAGDEELCFGRLSVDSVRRFLDS